MDLPKVQRNVVVRFCAICGEALQFDLDAMTDAERDLFLTGVVAAKHPPGRCRGEISLPMHVYRMRVEIFRDDEDEPLAMVSHAEQAISFDAATDALSEGLNERWLRLCDSARMAEQEATV